MEVKGRIARVFEPQSGVSQTTGNVWMSQEFLLDCFWWDNQTIATKIVLKLFGEQKIKDADLKEGIEVNVRYHIEAREYQGKWYNDVRCDRVERFGVKQTPAAKPQGTAQKPAQEAAQHAQAATEQAGQIEEAAAADDLPF